VPITPFHFGPGAVLHAVAPRQVSFLAFCAANVFIDCESLYNLVQRNYPVHTFFHTYVGATLMAVFVVLLFMAARRLADRWPLPDLFRWKSLSVQAVTLGAMLGAWSHVLLDSIMHADIRPLAPFSSSNAFLHRVSLDTLHFACLGLGALGTLVVLLRSRLEKKN
jgi:hypothetical protein